MEFIRKILEIAHRIKGVIEPPSLKKEGTQAWSELLTAAFLVSSGSA